MDERHDRVTEVLGPLEGNGHVDFLRLLAATDDLAGFLDQVVRLAAELTPSAAACGLTVERDRHGVTVASSDELASSADALQYDGDDGPCLQSMRRGTVVSVPDMAAERRWAPFPQRAASLGVAASLSLPLVIGTEGRGALNLYATRAHAFDEADEARARHWAGQVVGALAVATRLARHQDTSRQLAEGMESRSTISRAVGVIMGRQNVSADQAFEVLKTTSQQTNTKIRDLAARYLADFEERLQAERHD